MHFSSTTWILIEYTILHLLSPQSNDIDIMEYLYKKRYEVTDIVRKHTNHYPQKLQLTVEMILQKPSDNEPERVSVYFNTSTVVVYYEGISDETYEELVDSKVSKLVTFSSNGSGWQLLQNDKFSLKFVCYAPVRGRSFIPFPEGHLLMRDSNLLNIHNANDDKCFLYCYTVGDHLVYKKELSNLLGHVSDNGRTFWHIAVRNQVLNNLWVISTCQWVCWTYPDSKTWTKCTSTYSSNRHLFIY